MRELLPAVGCRDTPGVTGFDARSLAVREIGYWRDPSATDAEPRTERHCYGASRQRISSIDARLFMLEQAGKAVVPIVPNFRYRLSLTGRELRIDSVDAGERITMHYAMGGVWRTRDARASEQSRAYDVLGRPSAVHERLAGEPMQCVERFRYGEFNTAATTNQRGRLVRHDEPAGSRRIDAYALGGEPLRECQRLLLNGKAPDWRGEDAQCEAMLAPEPTNGYLTCRRFGALGDMRSQVDVRGNTQLFGYSVAGRQNAVDIGLAGAPQLVPIASGLAYNAAGQLIRSLAGNGVLTEYHYDPDDRLMNCRATRSQAPKVVQDVHYRYDPVGNVVWREDRADHARSAARHGNAGVTAECSYAYDSLYRLIESTGREMAAAPQSAGGACATTDLTRLSRYSRRYAYDSADNLICLKHHSAATRASFTRRWSVDAGSNRVVSSPDAHGAQQKNDFDAMGSLQRSSSGKLLAWNARNQLWQVTPASQDNDENGADKRCGDRERYGYDGSGLRAFKTREWVVKDVTHCDTVHYLPGLELRTNSATGETLDIIVVNGPCQVRIFHWQSSPPTGLQQDHMRYSLTDHLGSSAQELGDRAKIISYEEYYAFGSTALWATSSALEGKYKTIRYSGRERDATGFYYYGFRYYDAGFCRWLNADPGGTIDGLNLFCFVRNNPVTWRDADGRSVENRKRGVIYVPFSDKDALQNIISLNSQRIMRRKNPMNVFVNTEDDKNALMTSLAIHQDEDRWLRWGRDRMESSREELGDYEPRDRWAIANAQAAKLLRVYSADRGGFSSLRPRQDKLYIVAHGGAGNDILGDCAKPVPNTRSIASVADAMTRHGLRRDFDDIRLLSCGSADVLDSNQAPAKMLADRLGESGLVRMRVSGYSGTAHGGAWDYKGHKVQFVASRGPDPVRASEARLRFRPAVPPPTTGKRHSAGA